MNAYHVTVGLACIRHTYVIQARDIQDAAHMTRIWDIVSIVKLERPA